jgi:hypothetical protein
MDDRAAPGNGPVEREQMRGRVKVYSGRKNMSTIRLFIHIVYISQKKGVYMFSNLNQGDGIYLQFII